MVKVCKGRAFQNKGQDACFETDSFPHDTFAFDSSEEICAPGVTATCWAEVNTETKTAVYWAELG